MQCTVLNFTIKRKLRVIVSSMILTLSWDMGLKAKIPDILDKVSFSFPLGRSLHTSNFTAIFCKPIMGQRSK